MRTGEGYLAEVVDAPDGDGLLLIEHHCPICDAAKACTNLCSAELDLFRDVLGPDVEVIRTQHLIQGDQRCAYRLRPPDDAGLTAQVSASSMRSRMPSTTTSRCSGSNG